MEDGWQGIRVALAFWWPLLLFLGLPIVIAALNK